MVVDDEPDLMQLVKKYLTVWHFKVDAFQNPVEALAYFQQNSALYSLVLTDVRMNEMTGLELAQHMLRLKPDIKIILMTAFQIDTIDLERTLPIIRYEDILQKPFKLKQVCEGVRKQLTITT